ncbi:hypothetical protein D3C72_1534390 [compost metagenome]
MKNTHVPRGVAKAHGAGGQDQIDDGLGGECHLAAPLQQVLGPQADGNEDEEQGHAVLALREARRHGAIRGPDQRAGKGQAIAERVAAHVGHATSQIKTLLAAQHPANAGDGQQETRHDEEIALLPVEHDSRDNGEGRPQIIHHAHLDGLTRRAGITDRQRQAQLIGNEQHAAPDQIASRKFAQPRITHGQQQEH